MNSSEATKRLTDVIISGLGIIIFFPLFILVTGLVRLDLGSPVFFAQVRPGFEGRPFTILKFRTMRDTFDPDGKLLSDDQRLTRLGRIIRRTSIDELPQLWNVLKGEMSLVGPRPLLMDYLDLYSPEQMRRHETRPGITGWAQVNGRKAITWEEKFYYDVWYVDNRSFWLDIRILFRTVVKVSNCDGTPKGGVEVMNRFRGTSETGIARRYQVVTRSLSGNVTTVEATAKPMAERRVG